MYLCFIYLFLFKHSLQRSYTLTVGPFWNPVSQETEERLLCGTKMVLRESDVAPLVRYYRSVHAVVSLCLQKKKTLKCIMSVSREQFYSWCYTRSLDFFLYDTTNKILSCLWLVSSQEKRLGWARASQAVFWYPITKILRYYIIDLQESPKINFLSVNHCSQDLNELIDQP